MALIDDMVWVTFVETSEPRVCAGLALSTVKDVEEATVELGPSIDSGGAAISKVGLFRSKYGKGRGDGLGLFEEGKDIGIWSIAKGKSGGRYSIRLFSGGSLVSLIEGISILQCFIVCSEFPES
jgi:hypothetical protein